MCIRDRDEPLGIPLSLPAIVNVDVLVSRVFHARGNHRIGGFADQLLVHLVGKFIPTVPAHLRGQGQLVELLSVRAGAGQTDDDEQDAFHGRGWFTLRLFRLQGFFKISARSGRREIPVLDQAGPPMRIKTPDGVGAVSYTHLDVYKRQRRDG